MDNSLIAYLAESASELVHDTEALDPAEARARFDEAAELLALGAALLAKRVVPANETRVVGAA